MDKAALIAALQEMPDGYQVAVVNHDNTEAYEIKNVVFDAVNESIVITTYN